MARSSNDMDVERGGSEMELERGASRIMSRRDIRSERARGSQRERVEDAMDVDGDNNGHMSNVHELSRSGSNTPIAALSLANKVITVEERKRHAILVRDLLVYVNAQYRARWGTPPPMLLPPSSLSSPQETRLEGETMRGRDVEMVGA